MDNIPRKILCDLIKQHGRSLCDDPILLRNILLDKCGEYRREIHSLVSALQERVPQDLLMSSSIPIEVLLSRLTIKLQDHLPVTPEAARWAVESWALAIGVISPADLTAFKVKPTADLTPHSKILPERKSEVNQTSVIPDGVPKVPFSSPWKWAAGAGIVSVLAISVIFLLLQKKVSVTQENQSEKAATSPDATKKPGTTPIAPIDPSSAEPASLVNKGNSFSLAGNYEKAVEAYQQAILLQPDLAQAHYNLGVAYVELGRWQEAVEAYQQAIRLQPGYTKAYGSLGLAYKHLGRLQDAIQAFQQTIRLKPDDAETHCDLGVVYGQLNRWQEAMKAFQQAIHLNSEHANSHYYLGLTYTKLERWQEAIPAFKQAIRLQPNDAQAYCDLGVAYGQLGRLNEAMQAYQQAIRLKPDYANAHYNLGLSYLQMGNRDAALNTHKTIKDLDPKLAEMLFLAVQKHPPQRTIIPEVKGEFPRKWRVEWRGSRTNALYSGSLIIHNKINDKKYTGVIVIKTPQGQEVSQDAIVSINKSKVEIRCSSPSTPTYPADNFFLELSGTTMTGYDKDVKGNLGYGVIFSAVKN